MLAKSVDPFTPVVCFEVDENEDAPGPAAGAVSLLGTEGGVLSSSTVLSAFLSR